MTYNQGFFHCLQFELGDCWTSASIKPDLLRLITSVFLQSTVLKVWSAGIYKRLVLGCGDSLRGVAILTKIFLAQLIFGAEEL